MINRDYVLSFTDIKSAHVERLILKLKRGLTGVGNNGVHAKELCVIGCFSGSVLRAHSRSSWTSLINLLNPRKFYRLNMVWDPFGLKNTTSNDFSLGSDNLTWLFYPIMLDGNWKFVQKFLWVPFGLKNTTFNDFPLGSDNRTWLFYSILLDGNIGNLSKNPFETLHTM